MTKASLDDVGGLHGLLADHFTDVLKNGEVELVVNKETGEAVEHRRKPTAAMLAQIRQFLKDNNIQADRSRNKPLAALADALPKFEADEYDDEGNMTNACH